MACSSRSVSAPLLLRVLHKTHSSKGATIVTGDPRHFRVVGVRVQRTQRQEPYHQPGPGGVLRDIHQGPNNALPVDGARFG